MDRLIQVLRGIDEVEVARARVLAGDETWSGPRADAVRDDLKRLHLILCDAVDLAIHIRSARQQSIDTEPLHNTWDS
ncbi:MAG: hypothetical protein ACKOI2_06220 [Actinomycetota bacterium]